MHINNETHGVISYPDGIRHDDYLFRVSLKAVILNENNEVLVVKESGRDWWDIPGGGIDHGEPIKEALARELFEEVSYKGEFTHEPIIVENPRLIKGLGMYQMRLTFLVQPKNYTFSAGQDADEAMFVNPNTFKNSELITEQKIYEYSQIALARLK